MERDLHVMAILGWSRGRSRRASGNLRELEARGWVTRGPEGLRVTAAGIRAAEEQGGV